MRLIELSFIIIFCSFFFTFNAQCQIEKGFILKGLASTNVGLYYLDNGQEGKTIPNLGYSIGFQVLKVFSPKTHVGIEVQLLKTQSQIRDFRTTYGYYSPLISLILEETIGDLYVEELSILVPLVIRHNFGKKKNLYLEYGVDYKRLIHNNNISALKKIQYYPLDWKFEPRPFQNPIITDVEYLGFSQNDHRFGVNFGVGGQISFNEKLNINFGARVSNYTVLFFPNSQNPKFRSLELRCEIPILIKSIKDNEKSIKRYR